MATSTKNQKTATKSKTAASKKKKTAAKSKAAASKNKKSTSKPKNAASKKKSPAKKKTSQTKSGAKKKLQQSKAAVPKRKVNGKAVLIVIAAVLAVVGMAVLVIHLNARVAEGKKTTLPLPEKSVAWGIDVSSHNGDIDWETVAGNADFAFVRVGYRGYSEGEINEDERFADNLKGAEKNGVPVGVYFYSQAIDEKEAEEEAAYLLKQIKGYQVSLPVVIDFEYAFKDGKHHGRLWEAGLSKKERTALINAFCKKVRDAGYTPGIYASTYIYESQLNMNDIGEDVFIWVADYNRNNTYEGYYDIWQYSEDGSCAGVSSENVDTNYWYTDNRR